MMTLVLHHDIAEIMLKLALKTNQSTLVLPVVYGIFWNYNSQHNDPRFKQKVDAVRRFNLAWDNIHQYLWHSPYIRYNLL